jgi:predicted DNA-binding protein YlxM (UPF0122 family)
MNYKRTMYTKPSTAAKEFGVSRQWVYELIRRGELTGTHIAGVRLVIMDDRYKAVKRVTKKRRKG